MSTVEQIRAAIAAAVDGVGGLQAHSRWPGQVAKKAAIVRRRTVRFGRSFDGRPELSMSVSLLWPMSDLGAAQDGVDAALSDTGASSVIAALRVDPSFGDVVRGSTVIDASEDGEVVYSQVSYWSATVNLTVRNT